MGKRVSIIVAIYNVEEFLEKCIESILKQTYKHIEIICMDDGSTDNSGGICEKYRELDSRIIVIHQQNAGVAEARNSGVAICTGEYIIFVDGDDWLEPDMIQKLVFLIESSPGIGVAACNYFWNDNIIIKNKKNVPQCPLPMKKFLYYIYNRDTYKGVSSYVWNRLFKAEYFKENRITFDKKLYMTDDVLAVAECYLQDELAIYTNEPLYHYRQREGSFMHNKDLRIDTMSSCLAYEQIIDLFMKNHVSATIINYVKRFYVYHSLVLLKIAIEKKDKNKIEILKGNIKKYFIVYAFMNLKYPKRIIEAWKLLMINIKL